MQEVDKKEGYRSILEMGPLLLFFGVNYFYGIMAGTAVLVISTLLSLILSWYWFKNIPMMAAAGCVAVVFFGGLTIFFDDEFFIKIKPTIVSIIIAGVLASGKILGKNPFALNCIYILPKFINSKKVYYVCLFCFCFYFLLVTFVALIGCFLIHVTC